MAGRNLPILFRTHLHTLNVKAIYIFLLSLWSLRMTVCLCVCMCVRFWFLLLLFSLGFPSFLLLSPVVVVSIIIIGYVVVATVVAGRFFTHIPCPLVVSVDFFGVGAENFQTRLQHCRAVG